MAGADLRDPEVLRTLRVALASFISRAVVALGNGTSDLLRLQEWLRQEQLPYWRRQVRDREEAYQVARRAWLAVEAEMAAPPGRGPQRRSSLEEHLAMQRARRLRDEAEDKLATIREWQRRLEHDAAPLIHLCRSNDLALRDLGTKAVAQLDHLVASVEGYLSETLPPGVPPCRP